MHPTHRLLSALLLALAITHPARSATPADSRITAVTVYADRAVVTRTASLDLAATGPVEILFTNLPSSLLPASLQASGRGTAQITILDVAVRKSFLDHAPDEKLRTLEDEGRSLERQKSAAKDSVGLLDEKARSLVRIEGALTAPPTKDTARPTIEELTKLLNFLQEQRIQIATAKATLAVQIDELDAKIEALQNQIQQLEHNREQSVQSVTVRLEVATAGKFELKLSYSLTGAQWAPVYDARLRAEERNVELAYNAMVRNTTGENWQNIELTLSTARPSRGGGAPDLTPWVVDVAPPPRALAVATQQFLKETRARDANMLEYAEASEVRGLEGNSVGMANAPAKSPAEQDAATIRAAVDTQATSATFRIPNAVSIPTDGMIQKVGISTLKFAANLQFESTPKLNDSVYLHAYTTNTSDYPLLAGPMNTFLDGTFVATSRLNSVMSGEKFVLALGADEGIALKRRLVNRFSEDTGITSRTKRVTYDYLFTVTNNKKSPERVIFKDAVPVSRNEKVVVKVLLPSERDTGTPQSIKEVTREEDGRYVWRFDLKPGEKREFPFRFYVEYPSDLEITGLE